MTDPEAHAENVERLIDRLTEQGVPIEHEEGIVVITGSDGDGNHATATVSEDGVTTGYDVVVDFRAVEDTGLPVTHSCPQCGWISGRHDLGCGLSEEGQPEDDQ